MSLFGCMANYFKINTLACLMLLASTLSAQTSFSKDNFNFETFVLPGGVQANQVQQVTQDKYGFLWFATKKGLIKYDGRTFKTYQHQPDNPNSLPINFVEKLLFDSEGMLWIGTYGKGLVKFNTNTEEFSTPLNLKDWLTISTNIYVYALAEDAEKNIWIGTNGGLLKFNPVTKSTIYFTENKQDPTALNCNIVWNLYKDKKGVLWVATGFPWSVDTQEGGLHRYNKQSNDFTRFLHRQSAQNSLADNRVRAMFEDAKNNFWVGTMGDGLHKMNRDAGTFERLGSQLNPVNQLSRPYVVDEKFKEKNFSQVTFVHEDALGRLWVGAFNGGLNIYDSNTNQQVHFEQTQEEKGLSTNYLFSIFETADNSIFLCTGDGGNNKLIKVNYSTNFFAKKRLPKKDYSTGYVQSMMEDKAGNVWIGTMNGEGLFQWETKENKFIPHPSFLKSKDINALGLDNDGKLWIGYNDSGVQLLNPNNSKLQDLPIPNSLAQQLENESINTVFEDSRGGLWIPQREKGVLLRKKDGSIRHLIQNKAAEKGLSGASIDRILEDKKGHIWLFGNVQTFDGIYSLTIDEYNPTTNDVKAHLTIRQENGFFASVDQAEDGFFWFTNGLDGIKRFNPATSEITTLNTSNSRIPTGEILSLLVAKDGMIWMSSKDKIIVYNPIAKSFKSFGVLDGVNMKMSYGSILERKNGQLLFGGRNGFLVVNPEAINLKSKSRKPLIKFTDLKIDNQSIPIESKVLSKKPIWTQTQLVLHHNQRNFSLGLGCTDHQDQATNLEYFLENYDTYWRSVGPEKIIHYVNVSPGNYLLKTRGASHQGGWNEAGQSLQITVKSPWWQTWWAYMTYLVMGLGLFYTIYRFQLKRQEERQDAQKLKEIDVLKTKLYANITHEFRTPLTLILGQANQIKQEIAKENVIFPKVKSIEKSGQQLLRLVNQLLDIRKLESKQETLNLIQGDIVPTLNGISDNFESLAISRDIAYQIHLPHTPLIMDYDADKFQKVVSNLISNAIKFTEKGGRVTLFCQRLENDLIINIKDTGIGISAEALPQIFNRFYRGDNSHQISGTGIGLSFTKGLIDLMNGTIQVNSTEGVGTEFIIKLPITNQAIKTEANSYELPSTLVFEENAPLLSKNEVGDLPIILITEDNLDVAQFTASCLKGSYTIHFAQNGQEGIEKALEIVPDLIISDVMMPIKDGFQLCKALKQDEKTSHIPIILLTAKADIEDKLAGLERGADAYLAKPFNEKELRIRIQQLIQLREKLKERYAGLSLKIPSTDKALKIDDEFILKVREAVEANLDNEQFGVEELSKTIFLSRAQVHRKIKALTGKSSGQFIHTIRLHHALQFLQESDRSITAIAFDVGYNDPSYFTRMFTREFGQTPSYYAKKGA